VDPRTVEEIILVMRQTGPGPVCVSDLASSQLQPGEQDRIRDAADTLIFSVDLDENSAATAALGDVDDLLSALVKYGRLQRETAERLADDVYGCGPTHSIELTTA
jgi:hypothetical protein